MKPAFNGVANGLVVGAVLCAVVVIFTGRVLGDLLPLVVSGILVSCAAIGAGVAAAISIFVREIEADDFGLTIPDSEND